MLLEDKKVTIQASGMKDTVDFRAKLDGMMFNNLINGIYSNKIGAGIREYATNARDGHARRGNLDKPFEVSLPTRDASSFEVRDFGSSLTHQEVFDIFAVLGESTKRDTNDETGCLGLGSKSAFAYADSFTVTCWLNDTKRVYSCYIGENGQPKVSLISEIKSREPQGLSITYAVKRDDIDNFNEEATRQLRGFDPQPTIKRCTDKYKPLTDDDLILEGEEWKLYKGSNTGAYYRAQGKPMAIQGAVAYPIDKDNLALRSAIMSVCDADTSTKVKSMLEYTDVIIRFPIGELTMTTSREELAYDDRTATNIAKRCKAVIEDIQRVLDKEFEDCKSLKEARILKAKTSADTQTLDRVLGIRDRFWTNPADESKTRIESKMIFGEDGDYIGASIESSWNYSRYSLNNSNKLNKRITGNLRVIDQSNYRNRFGEIKAQFQWPESSNTNAVWHYSFPCDVVGNLRILMDVESEVDKNRNSLMRRYWKDVMNDKYNSFIWVKVPTMKEAKEFLEEIYHEERSNVTYLHTLTELKMPKKGTSGSTINVANAQERKLRIITGKDYAYSGSPAEYEVVDLSKLTETLPTIFFNQGQFYMTEEEMDKQLRGRDLVRTRQFINSYEQGVKLYVINGQTLKFYKDNKSSFGDAMEYLKERWFLNNKGWEVKYAASQVQDDNSTDIRYGKKFLRLKDKYKITFRSIDTELENQRTDIEQSRSIGVRLYNSLPMLSKETMKDELEAAIKKYPVTIKPKPFQDLVEKDEIIEYLINESSEYHNTQELNNAILRWKKLNNE